MTRPRATLLAAKKNLRLLAMSRRPERNRW